jgi:hypothetical protein
MAILYCLRFETPPQPGGPGPRIYITQEQGDQVVPPDTGFPFRRLLRLAGSLFCTDRTEKVVHKNVSVVACVHVSAETF